MQKSLEVMGFVLARARKSMTIPRQEILQVIPEDFCLWRKRDTPGWKIEEIVALSDYLHSNEFTPKRLSAPAIWRMENGTGEYSLKALLQYAYLLNLPALPLMEQKEERYG